MAKNLNLKDLKEISHIQKNFFSMKLIGQLRNVIEGIASKKTDSETDSNDWTTEDLLKRMNDIN